MAGAENEFEVLMERVRAGQPDAARELFDRYNGHVRLVVRRALQRRLRSQYDSMDFTQSVWACFFQVPADRFSFNSPEALVAFLSRVAYNKVVDTTRHRLNTRKNGLAHEQPLNDLLSEGPEVDPGPDLTNEVPARVPTPSQVAIAAERWEGMLKGQPPEYQRALHMLRQGHSHREVADVLHIHPKMLQRILQQLRPRADEP
jgi:RNA polymerase sigma factor (sigma-70 family)